MRILMARFPGLEGAGGRLAAARPPAREAGRPFPGLVAWCQRRRDPTAPNGLWLTFTVSVGVLAASAFGGITHDGLLL